MPRNGMAKSKGSMRKSGFSGNCRKQASTMGQSASSSEQGIQNVFTNESEHAEVVLLAGWLVSWLDK